MLSSKVIDYKLMCDEKSKELQIAIKEKYEAMDIVKKLQFKLKENERKILMQNNETYLNELINIFETKIKKESNEQKKLRKQLHQINEKLSIVRTQKDDIYRNDMAIFEQSLKKKQQQNDDIIMDMDNLSNLFNTQQMRDCIRLMKEWYLDKMNHLNEISNNHNITKSKINAIKVKLTQKN